MIFFLFYPLSFADTHKVIGLYKHFKLHNLTQNSFVTSITKSVLLGHIWWMTSLLQQLYFLATITMESPFIHRVHTIKGCHSCLLPCVKGRKWQNIDIVSVVSPGIEYKCSIKLSLICHEMQCPETEYYINNYKRAYICVPEYHIQLWKSISLCSMSSWCWWLYIR